MPSDPDDGGFLSGGHSEPTTPSLNLSQLLSMLELLSQDERDELYAHFADNDKDLVEWLDAKRMHVRNYEQGLMQVS